MATRQRIEVHQGLGSILVRVEGFCRKAGAPCPPEEAEKGRCRMECPFCPQVSGSWPEFAEHVTQEHDDE